MKYYILILVALFVVGCTSTSEPAPIDTPNPDDGVVEGVEDEIPLDITEPVEEEPPIETIPEPVCDTTQDPVTLDHITLSFEDKGLERSDDGFTFMFYPKDQDGNILPVEGNLQVLLYWTEIFNEERRSKENVFGYNKFIKLADVGTDCAPEPVFISFNEIERDMKYDVEEGDPGFIKVIFKRSGSYDEFEDSFMAPEGTSFFP